MTEQSAAPKPTHAEKPAAGTRVIVDVYARNKSGSVEFTHEWRWEDGTPGGGTGSIDIPEKKKGEPSTPIDFHLHDETDPPPLGLVFTDESTGAMWVKRDSCPPEDQQCDDPEIPTDQIVRQPKKLSVVDLNTTECELHYRLRFQDKGGASYSYDPDIKNGGTNLTITRAIF